MNVINEENINAIICKSIGVNRSEWISGAIDEIRHNGLSIKIDRFDIDADGIAEAVAERISDVVILDLVQNHGLLAQKRVDYVFNEICGKVLQDFADKYQIGE